MRNKTIVLIICAVALLLRLAFVAQSPTFAPEAYSTIRQVEEIQNTGLPAFHDSLDETRALRPYPIFPYLVAFGTLFMPNNLAYLLVPNLLAVFAHAVIFYLVLELTNSKSFATGSALASIFVPSYIASTLFTVSSISLAIPLALLTLALYIKLRKSKEHRYALLAVLILLLATHPIALIIVPTLLLALTLAAIRRASNLEIQYEFAVFATFLILWFSILYHKKLLVEKGLLALQGNAPSLIVESSFGIPSIIGVGLAIGLVPLGLSLYASYREGIARHPGVQATIALAIITTIALFFKVIPTQIGLSILGLSCIALGAVGLQHLKTYGRTLRQAKLTTTWNTVLIILFVATSILPTLTLATEEISQTATPELISASEWLKDNSLPTSIVLVEPANGQIVMKFSERKVYVDGEYDSISNAEEKFNVANSLLHEVWLQDEARKNRIDYVISPEPIESDCLNIVYRQNYYVQKVLCR